VSFYNIRSFISDLSSHLISSYVDRIILRFSIEIWYLDLIKGGFLSFNLGTVMATLVVSHLNMLVSRQMNLM